MSDKIGRNRTDGSDKVSNIPLILVPPRTAFRAMCIGNDLGYRLIRERVIPTIKLPNGPVRVPVDELRKILAAMVQVDRMCRTCTKRRDVKGKPIQCSVFAQPTSDIENCKAWTFDENWNIWVISQTNAYQGRVEKKGGGSDVSGDDERPRRKDKATPR